MDKVELIEQTKTFSKKELKVPFSVFFSILKEKFPNELKEVSNNTDIELSLNNDLNSEEFLICSWEEVKQVENTTEVYVKIRQSNKEELS